MPVLPLFVINVVVCDSSFTSDNIINGPQVIISIRSHQTEMHISL